MPSSAAAVGTVTVDVMFFFLVSIGRVLKYSNDCYASEYSTSFTMVAITARFENFAIVEYDSLYGGLAKGNGR